MAVACCGGPFYHDASRLHARLIRIPVNCAPLVRWEISDIGRKEQLGSVNGNVRQV